MLSHLEGGGAEEAGEELGNECNRALRCHQGSIEGREAVTIQS